MGNTPPLLKSDADTTGSAQAKLETNLSAYHTNMWILNVVSLFATPFAGGLGAYLYYSRSKLRQWPWDIQGALTQHMLTGCTRHSMAEVLVAALIALLWIVIALFLVFFWIGLILLPAVIVGFILYVVAAHAPSSRARMFAGYTTASHIGV